MCAKPPVKVIWYAIWQFGIDYLCNIVLYLCTICFMLNKGLFPGTLSAEILKFRCETVFGNSPFTEH